MLGLLWLVPVLPFAGFLVLAVFGPRLPRLWVGVTGVGSVGLAAFFAMLVAADFIISPPAGESFTQVLWLWMAVDGFTPAISLYLDALSVVMILVVTFVGFLIHLYSTWYMADEEGYSRFFAYMNLFVGFMLALVLADNLLLLFLGWEGVGLSSFLLIGFWYRDSANGRAARKAFIVTRVGDTAFLVGLFLLFTNLGTLTIQELMARATQQWAVGSGIAVAAAWLLLIGALGKSAQLPLQTWLPDAMAGPTPVSALIHAATMVTAGVYLIARTNVLFSLAPGVQLAVAIIGAVTLLYAGISAATQWDIKRALAYSTISQIGYMFLALGVGAWSAAIFHFMTHAFFKALLFLAAGTVILALHHEQDMSRMGGLRRRLPFTFWAFLIGAASMAGFPLVTAGFYSKDLILVNVWTLPQGGAWLWAAGAVGTFLTGLYAFRIVFLVFFGDVRREPTGGFGLNVQVPLGVLAFLAIVAGFVDLPAVLGNLLFLSRFLSTALPVTETAAPFYAEVALVVVSLLTSTVGVYVAYVLYLRNPALRQRLGTTPWGAALTRFWAAGWGFDRAYDVAFVRPYAWFAQANKDDFFDLIYAGVARLSALSYRGLSYTQVGQLRWYALGIGIGAALLIGIGVYL